MYVGEKCSKKMTPREGHSGHEESSSEIDATVTILRVGASGLRKERAISDLDVNKRNLVQIRFGLV